MKKSFKTGDKDEKVEMFFKLSSALFSHIEKQPVLAEFSKIPFAEICKKLKNIDDEINIIEKLNMVCEIDNIEREVGYYYLLILDLNVHNTKVEVYQKDEEDIALKKYSDYEKKNKDNKYIDVVLVSIDDVDKLNIAFCLLALFSLITSLIPWLICLILLIKAYPNYFLDSQGFVGRIKKYI